MRLMSRRMKSKKINKIHDYLEKKCLVIAMWHKKMKLFLKKEQRDDLFVFCSVHDNGLHH
jgi:lysophospholipid acyltransferase (LPLAT)-like uncharacterized protein